MAAVREDFCQTHLPSRCSVQDHGLVLRPSCVGGGVGGVEGHQHCLEWPRKDA